MAPASNKTYTFTATNSQCCWAMMEKRSGWSGHTHTHTHILAQGRIINFPSLPVVLFKPFQLLSPTPISWPPENCFSRRKGLKGLWVCRTNMIFYSFRDIVELHRQSRIGYLPIEEWTLAINFIYPSPTYTWHLSHHLVATLSPVSLNHDLVDSPHFNSQTY